MVIKDPNHATDPIIVARARAENRRPRSEMVTCGESGGFLGPCQLGLQLWVNFHYLFGDGIGEVMSLLALMSK